MAGGIVAIMGSGETSPTMVSVHRDLAARRPGDRAVLLQTPYGFQENVDDISARALAYFSRSVGLQATVLPEPGGTVDGAEALAALRSADWVFSGPGSPTYALDVWQAGPIGAALRDRVRAARGVTVFASAAAATMGVAAVPVYEIYKVGAAPFWLAGLDVLACLDLCVTVIPHYDNREGGTHDTRYCYLGERRLRVMEGLLPPEAAIVGVDEHTAVVLDLAAGTVAVQGRGLLTIRRAGVSVTFPAGTTLTLDDFRTLTRRPLVAAAAPVTAAPPAPEVPTLSQLVIDCEQRFTDARDSAGMLRAVLELEDAVAEWAGDTEEDDGPLQARAALRALIVRLAAPGLDDRFPAALPGLIAVRDRLRERGAYPDADAIRKALALAGIDLRDTDAGTHWSVGRERSPAA